MEDASKVMYKIANVLNWIALVFCVGLLIAGVVLMANANAIINGSTTITNAEGNPATAADVVALGTAFLIIAIWLIIIDVLFIVLTRIAYKKGSSQGWDILFLVLGLLSGSIFYTLGGIFGLVAKNDTKKA